MTTEQYTTAAYTRSGTLPLSISFPTMEMTCQTDLSVLPPSISATNFTHLVAVREGLSSLFSDKKEQEEIKLLKSTNKASSQVALIH